MSCNIEDVNILKHDMENAVGSNYMSICVYCNHSITFNDCYDVISKLKH